MSDSPILDRVAGPADLKRLLWVGSTSSLAAGADIRPQRRGRLNSRELARESMNPKHFKLLSDWSDLYRHLVTLAFAQHGPAQG